MKKRCLLMFLTVVLVSLAGYSHAGNSNRGHKARHDVYQLRTGYRIHHDIHHSRYGRHHGNCRHYSHRHHDVRSGLKIAAGALVLGTILHTVNRHHAPLVVHPSQLGRQAQAHWYRIDPEGHCVEVRLNQQGREVWTYVNPSHCY